MTWRWSSSSLRRAMARRPRWASGRRTTCEPGGLADRHRADIRTGDASCTTSRSPWSWLEAQGTASGDCAASLAAAIGGRRRRHGWPPPPPPPAAAVTIVLDDLHLLRTRAALDLVLAVAVRLPPATGSSSSPIGGHGCRSGGCSARGDASMSARTSWRSPGRRRRPFSRRPASTWTARLSTSCSGGRRAGRRGCTARCRALTARGTRARRARDRGSSRSIADYFSREVLSLLSVDAVRFLMRTAVLDRFCGSLCDAALRSTGSAAVDRTRSPRSGSSWSPWTIAANGSATTGSSPRCCAASCGAGSPARTGASSRRRRCGTRGRACPRRRCGTRWPPRTPSSPHA